MRTLARYYQLKAQSAEGMAAAWDLESLAVLLDPLKSRAEQDAAFAAAIDQRDQCAQRAREYHQLAAAPSVAA